MSFVVSNLEASRRFYRDLLGFSEIVRPGTLKERGVDGCWLFNFGVGLHLIEGEPPKRSKVICPQGDHFSFNCTNIAEVEEQLVALGVKYVKDQIDHEGICISQLFFHDPDGVMIECCNCDSVPLEFLHQVENCCQQITIQNIDIPAPQQPIDETIQQKRPQWQSGH